MKRHLFISVLCFIALALSSCSTTRNGTSKKLPPMKEISPILDSIVEEGYQLYYSERANWVATDLVFEKYQPEQLGSSVSYQPDKDSWTVAFFDKNNENCLMECLFDNNSNQTAVIDSIRPVTDTERNCCNKSRLCSMRPSVNTALS